MCPMRSSATTRNTEARRIGIHPGRRTSELRARDIVEGYYNLHTWRGVYYALDGQFIEHPGYNQDRGPVLVESVRMHVDF